MKEVFALAALGLAFFLTTKADGTRRFSPAKHRAQRA